MTDEGERIARLEALIGEYEDHVEALEIRVKELEDDRKSALITALLIIGGGFVLLFGIIARKAGIIP